MKFQAFVFDLDGTLVDSLPDLHAALNEMLDHLGQGKLSADEVRHMIGDGMRALVERALAAATARLSAGVTPRAASQTAGQPRAAGADFETALKDFLNVYAARPTKLSRLYPGVAETLKCLRGSGARLGVCTNKPQALTMAVLDGLHIAEYFDAIIGGDVVPFRKPDPRHLLAAVEKLGITPYHSTRLPTILMVGDSENDYHCARAAGVPVILMRYGYLRGSAGTITPDAWLDHFPDLPAASDKIANANRGQ